MGKVAAVVIVTIGIIVIIQLFSNKQIRDYNADLNQAFGLLNNPNVHPNAKAEIQIAKNRLELALQQNPQNDNEILNADRDLVNLCNSIVSGTYEPSGLSKIFGTWCESNAEVTFKMGMNASGYSEIQGSWIEKHTDGQDVKGTIYSGYFLPQNNLLIFYYSVSGTNGKATFQLSADGNKLNGTWEQNNQTGPWNLERCEQQSVEQSDVTSESAYDSQRR